MDDAKADGFGIGAPVRRKEDMRLLTGQGQYTSDQFPKNVCHAAFVRCPHAHARIVKIDTAAAKAAPGVLAVYTGKDLVAAGVKPIPHDPSWKGGSDVKLTVLRDVYLTDHHAMPPEIVRHIGEPVAVVIAETQAQASDAAVLIEPQYEPLPAVIRATDAIKKGAVEIWPGCPDNTSLDCEVGDKAATDAAFAKAAHVVVFETQINRVTGTPMEPRTTICDYDAKTGQYSVRAGSGGGVIRQQETLAGMMSVTTDHVRSYSGDMGGNFGTRNTFFSEYGVLPWAAKQLGRPVKWTGDRTECFLTDYQGRDLWSRTELALDENGKFLAIRGDNISNIGAYTVHYTPLRKGLGIMQGVYDIPHVYFRGRAVMTNTVPTTPYRSAGRPEAMYILERIVDIACDEHGFDPVKLRKRNLIKANKFPYKNAVGITYDSGDYARNMDEALELADLKGFAARKRESKKRGKLRGLGIANYIEGAGGFPRERAEITISPGGEVELVLGTMNSGQGHETSFAQLLVSWLGVPLESVKYVAHDTRRVKAGGGSHSGRSMRIASLAMGEAVDELLEKGKKIAAHVLQAQESEIEFKDGEFRAKSGGSIGLFEVAKAAAEKDTVPKELRGKFGGVGDHTTPFGSYPSGTHICEVEIDPDTGYVDLVRWAGTDDVGLAVNPMILHGQTHGAVACGVGQALFEDIAYDPQDGQMRGGSFMDYAVPRADTMPNVNGKLIEVPATSHRFGIRPGGEGGTTPALGCAINAVVDALSELGVRHVEMPATPERVWRAIQKAKAARG
ncbi:MAG: xanthine dehydrogenase family protein molybdopterin-binding subunit [Beijerinckiaceae bacterium]